jgi:DNA-binding MarR family transcriptional regulator
MSQRTERLATALGESTARIQTLLRKYLAQKGVSLSQARTLGTLEREGPRPLTELATLEQVSQPAMSYLVARLELNGHVRRSSDADDRRVVIVSITAAGRGAVKELHQRRAGLLADQLSDLPPTEIAALEAALPALRHLISGLEGTRTVGALRQSF